MRSANLTNQFLIAMPGLTEPSFHKTVTYICAHNDDGAMGIVINRPLDMALGEVLEQMDLIPCNSKVDTTPVYHGGPVQTDRGFVLHEPLSEWESSINVNDVVGVTTSRDILQAIARGGAKGIACGSRIRRLVCRTTGAGDTQQFLAERSGRARSNLQHSCEKRWQTAAALLGVDLERLSPDVGHA